MSTEFIVEATRRSDEGKGASRRLRREGKVPGVIYGGEQDPVSVSFEHDHVLHKLENEAFYTSILKIKVDGKTEQAVLRDVQRHPFKPKVTHLDLQRVSATSRITMHVPLHFIGQEDAPGVRAGGIVTHAKSDLVIVCAAKDLPEFLEVDMSAVELDGVVHISDIKLPAGVESVELSHGPEHDLPVAAIHLPRAAKDEDTVEVEAAEDAGEAAEGEAAEGSEPTKE